MEQAAFLQSPEAAGSTRPKSREQPRGKADVTMSVERLGERGARLGEHWCEHNFHPRRQLIHGVCLRRMSVARNRSRHPSTACVRPCRASASGTRPSPASVHPWHPRCPSPAHVPGMRPSWASAPRRTSPFSSKAWARPVMAPPREAPHPCHRRHAAKRTVVDLRAGAGVNAVTGRLTWLYRKRKSKC